MRGGRRPGPPWRTGSRNWRTAKAWRGVKHWDTAVIRQAGEVGFSEAHQRGAVVALWQHFSGDAHSLVWPNMTRASTVRVRVPRDRRYPLPMNR